jgi:hypothetical protein
MQFCDEQVYDHRDLSGILARYLRTVCRLPLFSHACQKNGAVLKSRSKRQRQAPDRRRHCRRARSRRMAASFHLAGLDGIVGTSPWIYTLASMVSLVGLCGAHVLALPPQPPAGFVNS